MRAGWDPGVFIETDHCKLFSLPEMPFATVGRRSPIVIVTLHAKIAGFTVAHEPRFVRIICLDRVVELI